MRDKLGAKPWKKQEEILDAVRDNTRVAVRSCNGSGKTFIAAHAVLWWLMSFPDSLVITTAPTEHQVRDVLWREIRRVYHGNEHLIGGKLLRTSLELGDKHYAQGLSTNTPERFQGFHEGNILFVVDEASGVREGIFEAIEGSMTSDHARMLLLGNPTALSGLFLRGVPPAAEPLADDSHIGVGNPERERGKGTDAEPRHSEVGRGRKGQLGRGQPHVPDTGARGLPV